MTASGLMGRLPTFPQATVDEVLDIRKEMAPSLTQFRSAMVTISKSFTSEAWESDFEDEVHDAWVGIVHPAVEAIEGSVRENRSLLGFAADYIGAANTALPGIGIMAAGLLGHTDAVQAVGGTLATATPMLQVLRDRRTARNDIVCSRFTFSMTLTDHWDEIFGRKVYRDLMNKTPDEELAELLTDRPHLQPSELNARLCDLWPLLHAPQRIHDATALVAMFRRAGYVSDGLPFPSQELTIYRGDLVNSREAGIAWTADVEVATQYARSYATAGSTRAWQATAPPTAVLARFKQEAEVVVAPDLLSDFKNLGGFAHFNQSFLGRTVF